MTARDRRTAWTGAALLAVGFAVLWFFPAEMTFGVFPRQPRLLQGDLAFGAAPEGPTPVGALMAFAAVALALGVGAVWYVPWLGRRVQTPVARGGVGGVSLALLVLGLTSLPVLIGGVWVAVHTGQIAGLPVVAGGVGMAMWFVAGVLGLVAVVRAPRRPPREKNPPA